MCLSREELADVARTGNLKLKSFSDEDLETFTLDAMELAAKAQDRATAKALADALRHGLASTLTAIREIERRLAR